MQDDMHWTCDRLIVECLRAYPNAYAHSHFLVPLYHRIVFVRVFGFVFVVDVMVVMNVMSSDMFVSCPYGHPLPPL